MPDANSLSDQQLLGVVAFLGAILAGIYVPFLSARGVEWCKAYVLGAPGDGLIVFDLLLGGVFAQATVVVVQASTHLLHAARLRDWWDALSSDHVLAGRALLLLVPLTLTLATAQWLRASAMFGVLPQQTVEQATRVGLTTLWTVVLANVFMASVIASVWA